jgi:hypothetical protein
MTEQLISDRIALARGLLREALNGMDQNDSRKLQVLDAWHLLKKADRTVDEGLDVGSAW